MKEQYSVNVRDFSAKLIASSGQCFRMKALNDDDTSFQVVCGNKLIRFHEKQNEGTSSLTFDCSEDEYEKIWRNYFDIDFDVEETENRIPDGDDYLRKAFDEYKGLRMLRQDKLEMLITSIITQRKSIPAIMGCVEKLCSRFGDEIEEGIYGFPKLETLAGITENEWKEMGVGYRAPYLTAASRFACENSLDEMEKLSTPEMLDKLMEVNGIGIKVANCVALFAYHRLDAAPVDVWIKKVIDNHYAGISPFPSYGDLAGMYQQYMFCYEREHKSEDRK